MIGVFDSGVGGLSVLSHIRKELPEADLLYVADRARAPYGPRDLGEVQEFSTEIADWLINQGAATVVVACNTASAAALQHLRYTHPDTPFVGMEPAVKPAALTTRTGVVGVFATAATFQGQLFESVMSRYTVGVRVVPTACPEWVALVEEGNVDGPSVMEAVTERVGPVVAEGADTLVLGCTHFSFLSRAVEKAAGQDVAVIDPAPAVARQTARVAPTVEAGRLVLAASGDISRFGVLVDQLTELAPDEIVGFP